MSSENAYQSFREPPPLPYHRRSNRILWRSRSSSRNVVSPTRLFTKLLKSLPQQYHRRSKKCA
ncbi:hypothetical protein TIFTF001_040113 [Ficus carica]|uniref:Uncharacterized protein n=1 Tax=Ficus carica TaxID=3494 RepID=A0AA87Z588_FICCA|nr:hypothetical protein TIFTF001_040113 [Ficus carica]